MAQGGPAPEAEKGASGVDDQQRPIGASSLGVAGTEAPVAEPAGARALVPADFPGQSAQWPGRRMLRPGERALVCAGTAALAAYLIALVASADWLTHPVLAWVTVVSGVAALAVLAASAWAPVPDRGLVWGRPLRWVPRPLQRDLARELRAGRPGSPELRPAAVDWTGKTLQAPWSLAVFPAAIAHSAGSPTRSGPTATWQLVVLTVLVGGFALLFGLEIARRRAAHRVADALERLTPPPPAPGAA